MLYWRQTRLRSHQNRHQLTSNEQPIIWMCSNKIFHKIEFLLCLGVCLIAWESQSLFDQIVDISSQVPVCSRSEKPIREPGSKTSLRSVGSIRVVESFMICSSSEISGTYPKSRRFVLYVSNVSIAFRNGCWVADNELVDSPKNTWLTRSS